MHLISKGIPIVNKLIILAILLITYGSVIVITNYLKVSPCDLDKCCGKLMAKDATHLSEKDVQTKVSDTKEHTIKDQKSQDVQFNTQRNLTEKAAAAEELYFR